MDLDFTKVTYDGELSDFSEDELTETIREFETAQESNVAEFEKAAEATDVDDSTIEDFEEAREGLIGDITESENFENVPLTEDKLEEENFSELQEWKAFVLDAAGGSTEEAEEEEEFDDFGTRSPSDYDDSDVEFADEELEGIQGLTLD